MMAKVVSPSIMPLVTFLNNTLLMIVMNNNTNITRAPQDCVDVYAVLWRDQLQLLQRKHL